MRRSWSSSSKPLGLPSSTFKEQQYGLKTWFQPESPTVDIVFIHGLKGDRDNTWTAKNSELPWPQTLLPLKVPEARILTYGYDSQPMNIRSMVSNNRIDNHAMNLLTALATHRQEGNSKSRPVIFVAHSMGGLICQDMLVASKSSPEKHLQNVVDSTAGIVFLGTPHSGSALALYAERLAKFIGLVKTTNPRIIGVLRRDSEVLARIQSQFHSMIRLRASDGQDPINITCFYEELPLPGVGEVVPHSSAVLHGYTSIGVHSHHKDMVRFSSLDDPGFISVSGELERWARGLNASDHNKRKELMLEAWTSSGSRPHEDLQESRICIGGNVVKSNVVNGSQVIYGSLTFQD
ncbi:hypothetical protein JX266_002055 [Neoarthrinium moseri]|nr:hypothetical protein JX266_002055 [Neoarthrinium moseri]